MKKQLLNAQYDRSLPLLTARILVNRAKNNDGKLTYHTAMLNSVGVYVQLSVLGKFKKDGLIVAPDLYEDKGVTRMRDEFIPEGGGRTFPLQVLPALREYYLEESNYDALTEPSEMAVLQMSEWMMTFAEEKVSNFGKKEICVYDEEITNDAVNPFLSALYLEMKRTIELISVAPPMKIVDVGEVILEMTILGSPNTIRTSRFSYDLKTGELTLASGKRVTLTIGLQHDLVIRAMHKSPSGLLTKEEIVRAAGRQSVTMTDKRAAINLIGEIREKLEIAGKEHRHENIFRTVRGQGYGLVE